MLERKKWKLLKKRMKKKRENNCMSFYLVAQAAHQTHAPPPPSSVASTLHLPRSVAQDRSVSTDLLLLSPLALSGAQAWSQGLALPRVGGSPSAASSDRGTVLGSAAVAPPPTSRQSPRTLTYVLCAPAGNPVCVRTSLSTTPASVVL